jgi:hypothetical protein
MNDDGQGISVGSQGVPFAVEAVNAPAGSDAAAVLAFTDPTEAVYSTSPIDLEFQLPPSVRTACSSSRGGTNLGWLALGALGLVLLLR